MENKQKNYKQCDMCKFVEATSLCPQCFCYYCDGCFKQVHSVKENKEHKAVEENKSANSDVEKERTL